MNKKEEIVIIFLSIYFILGGFLVLLRRNKEKEVFALQKEIINNERVVTEGSLKKESYWININKASKEELIRLPGIGEKIAQRIIQYREKNGKFKSKLELLKIKGIGKKRLAQIENFIEIK